MKYKTSLRKSDEGFSVSVPGLPGCWSQGETETEALENIKDAICEYLAVGDENLKDADVRKVSMPQHAQFSLFGMFLVVTGIGGGFAMIHGITISNPLGAISGMALGSCCLGIVAARFSMR